MLTIHWENFCSTKTWMKHGTFKFWFPTPHGPRFTGNVFNVHSQAITCASALSGKVEESHRVHSSANKVILRKCATPNHHGIKLGLRNELIYFFTETEWVFFLHNHNTGAHNWTKYFILWDWREKGRKWDEQSVCHRVRERQRERERDTENLKSKNNLVL